MFSTEIIINSLLYALNQAVTSYIDVLGTVHSAKDIYLQVKELCRSWGVTDTMLRNCWQFEEAVWAECVRKFEDTYFTFDSSIGKIQVVIYPEDMVFFFTEDITIEDIKRDSKMELFGNKYRNYDLTDGAPYYAGFTGFDDQTLEETERYELLYQVAYHLGNKDSAVDFIKQLIWTELLSSMHGCTADINGNMPCDNGVLCDRCHNDATMMAAYSAILYSLGLTK